MSESAASPPSVFVIMGAAVWEGGRPSNAMRRRVEGALLSARGIENPLFLASGGVGNHPPSEAAVMSRLLQKSGIPKKNIRSDVYHTPRCRWLFRLYGVSSLPGVVSSGRAQNTVFRWCYYILREFPALAWDTLIVLLSGRRVPEKTQD